MLKRISNKILFSSVAPLMKVWRTRSINENDIPELDPALNPIDVEAAYSGLETDKPYKFIIQAYFKAGKSAYKGLLIQLFMIILALSGSFILRELIISYKGLSSSNDLLYSIALVCLLAFVSSGEGILTQHFYYHNLKVYARISNGLSMRLFRHTLRLKNSSKMTTNTGDVVNHMASDIDGIGEVSFFLPELLYLVVMTFGVIIMLYNFIGIAAFVAVVALILFAPLAKIAAKRFTKTDEVMWRNRDERITLMSQILTGIRVIKYFAWEKSILKEVSSIREKEIAALIKFVKIDALSTLLFVTTSTVVSFCGFGAFVYFGGVLSAEIIFPGIMLFTMLEQPFGRVSFFIKNISHAKVATNRLDAFFKLEENKTEQTLETSPNQALGLSIQNISVAYNQDKNILDGISINVKPKDSIAIVGQVGAGKSTFLMALLGEAAVNSGEIIFNQYSTNGLNTDSTSNNNLEKLENNVKPNIGFVSQEAFVMNATVRENIFFEQKESLVSNDELLSILNDCALAQDVANMATGLETEIGERGVNLSGGQKQRLSLARAAAKKPGIVLLDDPLSAVDVNTETYLCEHLIFGRWSEITRIVVTHRLAHLYRFDKIIFLNNGKIEAHGTLDEILSSSDLFKEFYDEHSNAEEISKSLKADIEFDVSDRSKELSGRITDDEEREIGTVKWEVFKSYILALGGKDKAKRKYIFAAMVLTCLLVVVFPIAQSSWLAYWSDTKGGFSNKLQWLQNPMNAIFVYGVIGIFILSANYLERITWMLRAAVAGRDIHNDTLRSVIMAPIRFFDATPMGRILNRFSRDTQGVDEELSWNFESTIRSLTQTLGYLFLIVSVTPMVLIIALPALAWYYNIQKNYRAVAREAKRLESISRSPRYAHFKETLTGLTVIRAYMRQFEFTNKFVQLLSYYQRQYWRSIMVNRWFSARAPIIAGLITLATGISAAILAYNGNIKVGLAGMIVMYAINFWGTLNWTVRSFSEVEMRMTAVERLRFYAGIQPEKDTALEKSSTFVEQINKTTTNTNNNGSSEEREKYNWITNGEIVFNNVSARYAEGLPLVLNNLNLKIDGGSRVGIVGRTGSGKTTLFQSIFRFIEIEQGEIKIDGINIAAVPLEYLRRGVAVIPQDPLLFIGTVRSNLDRFNKFTDDEIWNAIARVQMKEYILLASGLEAEVQENGYNFSQGQRQLLCLARAILTNAKIIVMDEATASVDVQTDALIQQTIRTEFKGVTVLIIAHRLNSVADCDKIIEMNNGQAKEIKEISL